MSEEFNVGDQVWSRGTYLGRPIVVRRVFTVEDTGDAENGPCLELGENWREIRYLDTGRKVAPDLKDYGFMNDLALDPSDEVKDLDYIPCWDYETAPPMFVLKWNGGIKC